MFPFINYKLKLLTFLLIIKPFKSTLMKVISIFIVLCLTINSMSSCRKAARPNNFKGDWILEFSYQTKPWGIGGGNQTIHNEPVTITKNSWGEPINGIYSFSQEDETGGHWDSTSKVYGRHTGTITASGTKYLIRFSGNSIVLITAFPDNSGKYTTWQYQKIK